VSEHTDPLKSLQTGCWFKLICGASYQHLPIIRNLALAYTLAGIDCIDVAADPAVIQVVQTALKTAAALRADLLSAPARARPWLMMSINDGEDPHFRKASFNPDHCPTDCSRPCIATCPTEAIAFSSGEASGVISDRCYGCGRCLTVCPPQLIEANTHITSAAAILPEVINAVDAIEIHTQIGRQAQFKQLFETIRPYLPHLKLLAISCPGGPGVVEYLWQLYRHLGSLPIPLIWQTDGRPMSGDIGAGTTHATLRYGQRMLKDGPPGYIQLAGGTNHQTVPKLLDRQDWPRKHKPDYFGNAPDGQLRPTFGGVAYGSYARKLLQPILTTLEMRARPTAALGSDILLETYPDLLEQATQQCRTLIAPLKGWHLKETDLPPLPDRHCLA
jgi:Fe-S-cluster-containing hydrogenase component 2